MNLTPKEYIKYSQIIREPYKDRRSLYLEVYKLYLNPLTPPEITMNYQRAIDFLVGRKKFIDKVLIQEGEFPLSLVALLQNYQAYIPPMVLKKFIFRIDKVLQEVWPNTYLVLQITDTDLILTMKLKSRV